MEFKLVHQGIWYKPAYDEDYELSKKVPQGDIITAKTERQRNYELHKKAFKVLQIGYENQTIYDNPELFRARVLIGIGHCNVIVLENGQSNFIPKSMSYDYIKDDYEFGILYNKIVEKVAQIINVTNQELAEQVASQF
jgi:hypothetical protein